jgi:hypothetical protein
MTPSLLLPNRYKLIGWLLFIPFLALGIIWRFWDVEFDFLTISFIESTFSGKNFNITDKSSLNFTDEIALTGMITGLLFIAFAKEKREDEFISRTRLVSLQWAVLINYILLILASWFIHGLAFIDVLMYNMLTVLLLFIIRFHVVLNRFQKTENAIPVL